MSVFVALVGVGKDEQVHPEIQELLEKENNFRTRWRTGWKATIDGEETRILDEWKLTLIEVYGETPVKLEKLLKKHQKHYIIIEV